MPSIVLQCLLFLFLLAKDKNDGGKQIFREQHWKALDVLVVLFIYNLFVFAISYMRQFCFLNNLAIPTPYFLHSFLFLVLFLFLKFKFKSNVTVLGFRRSNLTRNVFIGVIVALLCVIVSVPYTLYMIKQNSLFLKILRQLKGINDMKVYVLYFLATDFLAPFVEECLCRGFLYSPFRKKYGPIASIVLIGLLFSVMHQRFSLPLVFLGIVLGILYEKTESLIAPVVAHSLYNSLYDFLFIYFY
jgi:membrane protease YdiL (CAAX protease family)